LREFTGSRWLAHKFEIIRDQSSSTSWFGGDDRDGYKPRNVGVGQSLRFAAPCMLQSLGFHFARRFDYQQNPDGVGHAVDLVLHVRSQDGGIIASRQKAVPETFDGGWVSFDVNLTFEADTTYVFTCYLLGGASNELMSSIYKAYTDVYPDGSAYVAITSTDTIDQWSDWSQRPSQDYNIRLEGEWLEP
jgi:hypothetical protein